MNPFDLYALETALQIKQEMDAHITVLSMGPPQVKEIIQEAFFMGDVNGVILTDKRLAGAGLPGNCACDLTVYPKDRVARPDHLRKTNHRWRHRPGGRGDRGILAYSPYHQCIENR